MYRSTKTRPQYLLRQLITTSLTAGSLLLMPLVGAAQTYDSDTNIETPVILDPEKTYFITDGVKVSSPLAGQDLFTAAAGVDFVGSANTPNFINNGTLVHVREDTSEDSATFRILADNFSFTNATAGRIIIGKNYPVTGNWGADGFVFSGSGGILTNDGDIEGQGDHTIKLEGSNNTVTNSGLLRSSLTNGYTPTDSWFYMNIRDSGSQNTVTNSGTIEAYWVPVAIYGTNFTLLNQEDGVINAVRGSEGVYSGGGNVNIANSGSISAANDYGVYSGGGNANITNSGSISASDDYGVYNAGDNANITNSGSISAGDRYGILITGENAKITNNDTMSSGMYAYRVYGNANTLVNSGTIRADTNYAYRVTNGADNTTLSNKTSGVIEAVNSYGVGFWDSTNISVTNAGTVKTGSNYAAYFSNDEDVSIVNSGTIKAVDEAVTILNGEKISLTNTNTGKITSSGGAAVTATDVKKLFITNNGTIDGNIEISIPRVAPKNYIPTIRLIDGTVNGDIIVAGNNNMVTSSMQKRDNAEVKALSDELKALKEQHVTLTNDSARERAALDKKIHEVQSKLDHAREDQINEVSKPNQVSTSTSSSEEVAASLLLEGGDITGNIHMLSGSILSLSTPSGTSTNSITMNTGSQAYCISLQGSSAPLTVTDTDGKTVSVYPKQFMSAGTDNCHAMLVANSGLLDARYDKLSDKIINLDHKLQDGNTDWLFEVRYQDMRQDTDENQPHANSTILALSKLWHTTRGDWIFQASHDSTHIGQHLNNNSAAVVLGHSQNWGKTSELHMQLGGDRREMSLNLVGEQDTVTESSNYSVVYGEIGMGRVLHKIAGHDINMRMRLAAERIGSIGKGWDSDTVALMIPELSVSGRVLPSLLTDASHRLYAFAQKPIGDTKQKYTITGHSESTLYYDTDVSGGIGYDLHTGVGANTMLHAKASYLNTGYLSLGLGISQNL